MSLKIKSAGSDCHFDQLSLGEVMLRLDPGETRVRTARHFTAWEGGGEYNTSRGSAEMLRPQDGRLHRLRRQRGRTPDRGLHHAGRRGTDFIKWREDDGIGRTVRNGLNFTERGFGIRGAVGVPDRGNTAASQLKPGDFNWDHIFGKLGVRWFHTGGIFAALSESTAALTVEAVQRRQTGTAPSYPTTSTIARPSGRPSAA
jgi:2-dehydro-3-deoxygluconokinase